MSQNFGISEMRYSEFLNNVQLSFEQWISSLFISSPTLRIVDLSYKSLLGFM